LGASTANSTCMELLEATHGQLSKLQFNLELLLSMSPMTSIGELENKLLLPLPASTIMKQREGQLQLSVEKQ
jgi:hypothetical protein